METELTDEELLRIYGGQQQTSWGNLPYIYGIDGTPLQGQAIIALAQGHGQPIYTLVGDIYRTVAVRIGDTVYDLPGDNPNIPGKY